MRARLDQTASKNNPFIFIHHRADGTLCSPLREKLKERKRLSRIRVDFIGAILSKKTVLRILMQRKFDCDGVLLGNSYISLSLFCLDRCVILKPENWTILLFVSTYNFFEMYTFFTYYHSWIILPHILSFICI